MGALRLLHRRCNSLPSPRAGLEFDDSGFVFEAFNKVKSAGRSQYRPSRLISSSIGAVQNGQMAQGELFKEGMEWNGMTDSITVKKGKAIADAYNSPHEDFALQNLALQIIYTGLTTPPMVASYNQTTTVMSVGDSCFWNIYNALRKRWAGNTCRK
ncbi:hypothetical protein LXL04_034013 [Taraxacum kok-saghyz]